MSFFFLGWVGGNNNDVDLLSDLECLKLNVLFTFELLYEFDEGFVSNDVYSFDVAGAAAEHQAQSTSDSLFRENVRL